MQSKKFDQQPASAKPALTDCNFNPDVTVAVVVEREGKFLVVQEHSRGRLVINQPAGHLEPDESLIQAAVRETYEETGWRVEITELLGLSLYRAPTNGVTYLRTTFVGAARDCDPFATLDDGIVAALWLTADELADRRSEHRSPLVMQAIVQYQSGQRHPLSILNDTFIPDRI